MRAPQISGVFSLIVIALIAYAAIGIAVVAAVVGIIAVVWYFIEQRKKSNLVSDSELKEAANYFMFSQVNEKLFDAIKIISNKQGIKFISNPKSINFLSDYYNFTTEPETKKIILEIISSGTINNWISMRKQKSKLLVQARVSLNNNLCSTFDQKLVKDVVLTILSAIAKITHDDIIKFALNPASKGNQNSSNIDFKLVAIYVIGLLLMYGGTIFYMSLFQGWWLFFIVLITGFVHLEYFTAISFYLDKVTNTDRIDRTKITLLPIFIGMILNALLGFAFFFDGFRTMISEYIYDYPDNVESPYFITGLLLVVDLFFLSGLAYYTLGKIAIQRYTRLLKASIIIVFLGYVVLLSLPAVNRAWHKFEYAQSLYAIKNGIVTTIDSNNQIRIDRLNRCPDLSFKGIKLGMNITDVDSVEYNIQQNTYCFSINRDYSNYCDADKNFDSQKFDSQTQKYVEYYKTRFFYDEPIFDAPQSGLAYLFGQAIQSNNSEKPNIIGKLLTAKSEIDNKNVTIYIFENMDKVGAILVEVITTHADESFSSLKELYSKKYGTPENVFNVGTQSINAIYWTFKNGTIYLDGKIILYIDSIFISQLQRQSDLFKQEQNRIYVDSIRRAQIERETAERHRIQSEQAAKAKAEAEKARKEENHKNAINEI
jgi:hypothetical protein